MTAFQRRLQSIAGQMQKQGILLPPDAQKVRRAWRLYRMFQTGTCPPMQNGDDFCDVCMALMDALQELKERDHLAPADIDGPALFAFCEVFGQILADLFRAEEKGEPCLQERHERIRAGQASTAEVEAVVAWQLLFDWQERVFGVEDAACETEENTARVI